MNPSARIIYAGTPEFALTPLQRLFDAGVNICAVYTQPDRKAGRGRKLTASPVKRWALSKGLSVRQPETLKDKSVQQELNDDQADLMVVTAYGLILPPAVLAIPAYGCVNLHASLLPRWRGAAPIQRAILAGDKESGITLMHMDEGLDTGGILVKRALEIHPGETSAELHDRIAELGANLLLEALPDLLDGNIQAKKQSATQACYARKIDKQEAWIDWQQAAKQLAYQVCAFNPWPVAQTVWDGKVLRLWRAEAIECEYEKSSKPGTVLHVSTDGIDVVCGVGVLRILELQLPGARAVSCNDFIHAHTISGAVLG